MPYILQTNDGTQYSIDITTRMDFDFQNAIIVYESIGEDGGYTINNGRLNSSLNLNVTFSKQDMNNAFTAIARLKAIRGPVIIAGKSKNMGKLFGKFVIAALPGTVEEGSETVKITVQLTEYRQANVRKNVINAVYQGDAIIDFLNKNNFISK